MDALGQTALLEREDNDPDPDHVAAAAKLVDWGVPVAGANEQGITLLMEAINRGRPALVRFALQAGSPIDQRCECSGILEGGFTPLIYALTRNEPSPILEMLLAQRADPNAHTASGRTPLLVLLDTRPEPDLVQRLIAAGADVNAADQAGRTPLTAAAARGDLTRPLLATGARADTRSDGRTDSRLTPLMRAAYADAVDSIRLLLDAKADIDARSGRGRTALMMAVLEGARDSAALLLQRGARADLRDEDGASALDLAATLPAGEQRTRMLTTLRKGAAP